jgi:DNA polymerase III gamma/tau subunit
VSFEQVLTETIEAVRAVLHLAITSSLPKDSYAITKEHNQKLTELSAVFTPQELTNLLDICLKRRQDSRYSPLAELPLELVVSEFCYPTKIPTTSTPSSKNTPSTNTTNTTPSRSTYLPPPQPPTTKTVDTATAPTASLQNDSVNKPTPTTTTGTLSSEELSQLWKKIIEWVGTKSHSLTFILNTAKILTISHDRVTLGVPYDFHRDKLSEAKNKKLVEQAIQEVTKIPLLITCETIQNSLSTPTKTTTPNADVLDSLASSFGGEVVASSQP